VVFIQETHLSPTEGVYAAEQHAAGWGYRGSGEAQSHWSAADGRRGGLGILLNPYGAVKSVKPWSQAAWTPHLMMVQCVVHGEPFLLVNIYAPSSPIERKDFFASLAEIQMPTNMCVLAGGDFNCVSDGTLDRRGASTGPDAGSAEVRCWADSWAMEDIADQVKPTKQSQSEMERFASNYHTYR
jgi:hypothetical protein